MPALAVYIKGDKKPTDIYSASLILGYEGGPQVGVYNLRVVLYEMTNDRIEFGDNVTVAYEIFNDGPSDSPRAGVRYTLSYSDTKTDEDTWPENLNVQPLGMIEAANSTGVLEWSFATPVLPDAEQTSSVNAKVTGQLHFYLSSTDFDPDDNKDSIKFQIKKNTSNATNATDSVFDE